MLKEHGNNQRYQVVCLLEYYLELQINYVLEFTARIKVDGFGFRCNVGFDIIFIHKIQRP
jgi:hypothetical protein